jgi:DNA ligase D-like protein (predicted ligase)
MRDPSGPESTARPMSLTGDPFDNLPVEARRRLRRRRQADWYPPMLATLTEERFSDPAWLFERKLDGERCLAFRRGRRVRLLSRNQLDLTTRYPEVAGALGAQAIEDLVVDGEIVAFARGQTSFERLQRRMQVADPSPALVRTVPVRFVLFDLLHATGMDARDIALDHRKEALRGTVEFGGPLRFTAHTVGRGEAAYRNACARGWEGVIAKRRAAPYVAGRSREWLKFKCVNEQEFAIGGWTEPKGSRVGLGAILIGHYQDGHLRYAGKVGTGFDRPTLLDLAGRLRALEQPGSPFTAGRLPRVGVHWVRPELVCQVGFSEWTRDGELRHPRFLGLRDDKDPREVVRERPA